MKRFEDTEPLAITDTKIIYFKYTAELLESELYLEYGHRSIKNIEIDKEYKIVAGLELKLEKFVDHDLLVGGSELPNLFHRRVVNKMQEICPEDFIVLPVTITNLDDKVEAYENKDFYIVNALNTLDALDRDQSVIKYWSEKDEGTTRRRVFKDNPWDGHYLAFCRPSLRGMIYHPKLARALYPNKYFDFATADEKNAYSYRELPRGMETNEMWLEWKKVMNVMKYPERYVSKALLRESNYGAMGFLKD